MADTTALASLRTKRLCEGKILPLGVSGSQRKIYGEQRGLCSRNIKRKKTLESRKIYLYEHIGYNFSQWRYYWSGNFTKACLSHKKMPRKRSPWWLIVQWTGFVWSVFLLWWRWHGGCPRNSVPAEAHILLCPSRNLCNDAIVLLGTFPTLGFSVWARVAHEPSRVGNFKRTSFCRINNGNVQQRYINKYGTLIITVVFRVNYYWCPSVNVVCEMVK